MDLRSDYIEKNVGKGSVILIIGCGISGYDNNNPDDKKLIDNLNFMSECFTNFKVTISDVDDYTLISRDIFDHLFPFSKYKKPSTATAKAHYLKINLLNNADINSIPNNTYDYIELRYVLHFKIFQYKRENIIKELFKKIRKGGKIGIQFFTSLNSKNQDNPEYEAISTKEIQSIESIGKLILSVTGIQDYNQYATIVLGK